MVDTYQQLKIYPYDGSQDSTRHPLLISPTDIVDSDNIVYTTYSTKKKRPGISHAFQDTIGGNNHILGGCDFWRLGSQYIVYYDGVKLYAIKPDGTKSNISATVDLPIDEAVSFCQVQGLLCIFFTGGNTPPKKWTQTGQITDLSPDAPNAAFGRVFLNSLWIPDPTVPGRILKSVTGDPTDFTGGDAAAYDLDPSDGDPEGITAIFPPFYGSLYVSKRYSIFRLTPVILGDGSTAFSVLKIVDGIGCISHNAVVPMESTVIFPSDRGIHHLESTNMLSAVTTNFLSANIQPPWFEDTNFNRSKYMQAVYDQSLNSYILIFPRQGSNYPSDVWGFSIPAAKWYRWRSYNHTSIFRYVDFQNKKLRTMVGSEDGEFGVMDDKVNRDYGRGYSIYLQSGIIAPSGPDKRYQLQAINPIFVPQITGKFNLTYKINGKTIETLEYSMTSDELGDKLGEDFKTGISVLGGLPEVKMDSKRTMGSGNFYSLLIEHTPTPNIEEDEGFELLGVLLDVEEINRSDGEVVA